MKLKCVIYPEIILSLTIFEYVQLFRIDEDIATELNEARNYIDSLEHEKVKKIEEVSIEICSLEKFVFPCILP